MPTLATPLHKTRQLGPDTGRLILSQGAQELLSGEQRQGAC